LQRSLEFRLDPYNRRKQKNTRREHGQLTIVMRRSRDVMKRPGMG
jgi:hypothetical protein